MTNLKCSQNGFELSISENAEKAAITSLAKVLEPFGIGLAIISDHLNYFRVCNLINIVNKIEGSLKDGNIDSKPISKSFLARFIEDASFEENDILQSMWANLFAHEVKLQTENTAYIHVLKELNAKSAQMLKGIYLKAKNDNFNFHDSIIDQNIGGAVWADAALTVEQLEKMKNLKIISYSLIDKKNENTDVDLNLLVILEKLSLIKISSYRALDQEANKYSYVICASITSFGFNFVSVCEGLNKK